MMERAFWVFLPCESEGWRWMGCDGLCTRQRHGGGGGRGGQAGRSPTVGLSLLTVPPLLLFFAAPRRTEGVAG